MQVEIRLPRGRQTPGRLEIPAAGFVCPCLGRADAAAAARNGNPTRDQRRRNGDTPAGRYLGRIEAPPAPARSYGPHPVVRLFPQAGAALEAAANGRDGLLIHGGDPAADGVTLRPTFGCIRLANADQARMVEHLRAAASALFPVIIEEF